MVQSLHPPKPKRLHQSEKRERANLRRSLGRRMDRGEGSWREEKGERHSLGDVNCGRAARKLRKRGREDERGVAHMTVRSRKLSFCLP